MLGGSAAVVAGFFWVVILPATWTVDAGGITKEGPFRRRDLRWGDVRRIMPAQGYEFYGRSSLIPLTLRWDAVPKHRREAVRAGVEAVLREHFDFPERPPPMSLLRALVWMFAMLAAMFGPPVASWWFWGRLANRSPQTVLGWAWVQRLFAWNSDTEFTLKCVVFVPGIAYIALATCLLRRKAIREEQIILKRPDEARDGCSGQSKSPGSCASGER